jgi:hypothetical protein
VIDLFTKSYPEELLFSLLSRYHLELFSEIALTASIGLQAQLEKLLSRLLSGREYSASRLIDRHTLFPFYSPFTPESRLNRLLHDLDLSGLARTRTRLRVHTLKGQPRTLRYCPICAREDRRLLGETYWHRLPQVPGVEVCPAHETYFVHTEIQSEAWVRGSMSVTAEKAIGADSLSEGARDPHFSHRLRIAQDAAWLLENPILGYGPGELKNRYLELCFRRGSCTYSGVLSAAILQEIRAFYSDDFLQLLGCALSDKTNWPSRVVHEKGGTQPTLCHLLMMQFLGVRPKEFFELPEVRLPFGPGPWPCLNSASEHLGQKLITTVELSTTTRRSRRLPLGTFHCACGFAYSRVGPDRSELDQYHIDGYVSFGEQWDNRVRTLVTNGNPVHKIAADLDINERTLVRELLRLGLTEQTRAISEQWRAAKTT